MASVKVGRSIFQPLKLGQECANIYRKRNLPHDFYYIGEAVSVRRPNDRRIVGQVIADSDGVLSVTCGFGNTIKFSHAEVKDYISKFLGNYFLSDGVVQFQEGPHSGPTQTKKVGSMVVSPLFLGQGTDHIRRKGELHLEYYYKDECVSVKSGSIESLGEVTSVGFKTLSVMVRGLEQTLSSEEVPKRISKFIGAYYLSSIPAWFLPAEDSETIQERVQAGIDEFFRRHDDKLLEEVFNLHANDCTSEGPRAIRNEELGKALEALNVKFDFDDVAAWFTAGDANQDGMLELGEFKSMLKIPPPAEAWAHSLNLPRLLAYAMSRCKPRHSDPVLLVSSFTEEEMGHVVDGFCGGLKQMLTSQLQHVKEVFNATIKSGAQQRNHKFDIMKMENCGNIDNFHQGLQDRIGACQTEFMKGIKEEHCERGGCDEEFTTLNFQITTTPHKEWDIVVNKITCPPDQMSHKRRIPDIQLLLSEESVKNAKLREAEVVAMVLYTGPMHHAYNAILRRHPADLYQRFSTNKNLFSTTIAVLASAVIKLSRVAKLPEGLLLYRGLGGTELPDSFTKPDPNGFKGYLEWGFMSTTSHKEVAIEYSGLKEHKPAPRVLAIRVGSVDRGACVAKFSQYEKEVEYLFVPCSFLQQDGHQYLELTEEGVVVIYPVRVNANLKTLTVEEHLGQKKSVHLAAFSLLVDEIDAQLRKIADEKGASSRLEQDPLKGDITLDTFLQRIVQQCHEVRARHEAFTNDQYSDPYRFQSLALEMVDVKDMAMSKLLEWLENKETSFLRYRLSAELRTAWRRHIAALEKALETCDEALKQNAALRLCKAKKLVVNSVAETNELQETRIMAAAAEGFSFKNLSLLLNAGADVNDARPDGVTAVWLAAQFGHSECIQLLHLRNANVSLAAKDGATPVYIAAQNGNSECIRVLIQLGANESVNKADSVKGFTPLHQAAMNNRIECIILLHRHSADLNGVDKNQMTPLHLAAKHGHAAAIETLFDLKADPSLVDAKQASALDIATNAGHDECCCLIRKLAGKAGIESDIVQPPVSTKSRTIRDPLESVTKQGKLIISTGDLGDVDGFLALAEYARTGADVLFVMNYHAYIGVSDGDVDEKYAEQHPGLGYKYGSKEVLNKVKDAPQAYQQLRSSYGEMESSEQMKSAMTDMAHAIANRVWDDAVGTPRPHVGKLLFCIGGVNLINPFSAAKIKNELLVYAELMRDAPVRNLPSEEGVIYDKEGNCCEIRWDDYQDIYMDFNGPMSFWNDIWENKLTEPDIIDKFKGAFIMGGVHADVMPTTMPSIPGFLNRFSSATMNQLYYPQKTAKFFAFLYLNKIRVFTITSNVVPDLSHDGPQDTQMQECVDPSRGAHAPMVRINSGDLAGASQTAQRELQPGAEKDNVDAFLNANGLNMDFLKQLAAAHYNSPHKPRKKPFDFCAAKALTAWMRAEEQDTKALLSSQKWLLYSNVYGITFVSSSDDWKETIAAYARAVAGSPNKDSFATEIEQMSSIRNMPSLQVYDVKFNLDDAMVLRIVAANREVSLTAASQPDQE